MTGEESPIEHDVNAGAQARSDGEEALSPAPCILIVEDNAEMRRFLEQVLGHYGYRLLEASDGVDGVQITQRERPDLILMDLSLPQLDGVEATRQIKADPELSHIPIIAVTAHARASDEERALEAGCNAYLSKPYSLRSLVDLVQTFLPIQRGS